jgi:hypothetical protein
MPNTPKTLVESVGNDANRIFEHTLAIGSLSAADRSAIERMKQEAAGLQHKYPVDTHVGTRMYVNDVKMLLERAQILLSKYSGGEDADGINLIERP